MEMFSLPSGNGQEIYIEPDELDISPNWINEELHAIFMPDLPESETYPVYKAYQEFFLYLYEMGYKVVTRSEKVSENAFFFTACYDKHINTSREVYQSKKDKKVELCLQKEGITKPLTVFFQETSFPITLPSFPMVLKNEESQGGEEKFFIETEKQLEILKKFYEEINSYAKKRNIEIIKKRNPQWPDLEIDETGRSNHELTFNFTDYKKIFHESMVLQKYIKTPTKYNTSLRVVTSSSGDILCASLKYAEPSFHQEEYYGLFDTYLLDSSSPYFLGNKSIISNTVAGGKSILLGKEKYSELEQEILLAHGIDVNNSVVPEAVENACTSVAINCSREIGAICGMDFIYDEEKQEWKYLEEHERPMLYSYAEKYNFDYDFNSENFFTVHALLDLKIRMHSLYLTMQKKLLFEKERGKHI